MERFFGALNRLSPVELALLVGLLVAIIIAAAVVFQQLQPDEGAEFVTFPTSPAFRAGQLTEEELQLTRDALTAIAPTPTPAAP